MPGRGLRWAYSDSWTGAPGQFLPVRHGLGEQTFCLSLQREDAGQVCAHVFRPSLHVLVLCESSP